MKQFTVNECGKTTWLMRYFSPIEQCADSMSSIDFCEYTLYFHELFEVIGEFIDDIDLCLEITEQVSCMVLHLDNTQLAVAENIKTALLECFPETIECVGIVGNEVHILDYFFEYYVPNELTHLEKETDDYSELVASFGFL